MTRGRDARRPSGAHTLGAHLEALARRAPGREAAVGAGWRLTYGELQALAERTAAALWRCGVRRGDPVALLVSNRPEWIVVAAGCARLGAPLVPISTWSRRLEVDYVLRHSGAAVLIMLDRFAGADYQEMLAGLAPETDAHAPGALSSERYPALREVVVIGRPRLAAARSFAAFLDLAAGGTPSGVRAPRVQPEDILFVLYTSGTTSRPKGVPLAHGAALASGRAVGARQHLRAADRVWVVVPLFWSFGSANALMAALGCGATVVLQERFDPDEAVRLIAGERCTVYYGLPHMARAMLQCAAWGRYDTGALRKGLTIGSPEEILLTIRELGVRRVCNGYAMTETYGNVTATDAADAEAIRVHTQGTLLPGMRLRVVDPETRARLPAGAAGELLVAGRVTPGYFRDIEATARAFDDRGYLATGDLGFVDRDGRLHFRSRLREIIKSGGINISPTEVEDALMAHPAVHRAYVVAHPDPVKGEVPVAAVEVRPGGDLDAAGLSTYLRDRIASYKIPVAIVAVRPEEIPRTDTGKVHRGDLRALLADRLAAGAGRPATRHETSRREEETV